MTDLDVSAGWVRYDVYLFLSSESGRAKHTDLTEQGAWLRGGIQRGLQTFYDLQNVAFGDLRYMGAVPADDDTEPVSSYPVGPPIGPLDDDLVRRRIATLRGLTRELGRVLGDVLDRVDDPNAILRSIAERNHSTWEAVQAAQWAVGDRGLEDIEREAWRNALRDDL